MRASPPKSLTEWCLGPAPEGMSAGEARGMEGVLTVLLGEGSSLGAHWHRLASGRYIEDLTTLEEVLDRTVDLCCMLAPDHLVCQEPYPAPPARRKSSDGTQTDAVTVPVDMWYDDYVRGSPEAE